MGGAQDGGTEKRAGDAAGQNQDHTAKLHADVYTAPLNKREIKDGMIVHHPPLTKGPNLTDLTIDTKPGDVVVHDVPRQGASYQERREAAKREMPISNEHFRDLVKQGTDYMAMNDGNFNIQMRNALNEANQSDQKMGTGHRHVDDVLKYANAHLNDTDYTLRRHGNEIEIWDAHQSTTKPAGKWNLNKNAYE
jgi:hypothetical protein